MRAGYRALRVVLIGAAFFVFWTGGAVLAWTLFPLLKLTHRDELRRRRACKRVLKYSFRFLHGYMRALRLLETTVTRGGPAFEGPCVMVANHQTLVDVTALLAS